MTTTLTHIRTENGGTPELITREQAADETNAAAADRKGVPQMSTYRGGADIHYRDGRHVEIRPATPEEIAEHTAPAPETDAHGRRIITVNGKRYIVSAIITSRTVPQPYVDYWSERNGHTFGSTRWADATCKSGTVGAGIWAAANR